MNAKLEWKSFFFLEEKKNSFAILKKKNDSAENLFKHSRNNDFYCIQLKKSKPNRKRKMMSKANEQMADVHL